MVVPFRVRVRGPLAEFASGLWSDLQARGYTPLSSAALVRLLSHLSRWLEESGLQASDLSDRQIDTFLVARRQAGYTKFLSRRGLEPIRQFLSAIGVTRADLQVAGEASPLDRLLADYTTYLVRERSLTPSPVRLYVSHAERFLRHRCGEGPLDLGRLKPDEITRFILEVSGKCSLGQTRNVIIGLRSLLRFLHVRGDIPADLTGAVPAVAGWRQASLPKFLLPEEVDLLLESCDRRTHAGRRDHAILVLLARLGLRAGEVAGLDLDDMRWQDGEIVVRGKGGREDRLPMPTDVGTALASYLRRSRRWSSSRALFLILCAPHTRISRGTVTGIVYRACERAGLPAASAHRLRHSAATTMLREGASLTEIAQVLRHHYLATTAIYAKVDRRGLRELAQPWVDTAATGFLRACLAEMAPSWPGGVA